MSEETQDVQLDDVEEIVEDVKDDEDIEEERVSTEDKDSTDSIIGWIKNKLSSGEKASPDDLQEDLESEDNTETEGEEIPEAFSEAALKAGWDEEMIQEFSTDYSDDELVDMIPHILGEDKKETVSQEQTKESEQKDKSTALDKDADVDKFREQLKEELKKELEAEFGDLKKSLSQAEEKREAEILNDMERQANGVFDDVSKDFEVFGKTEDLPKFPDGRFIPSSPAFQARSKVYGVAMGFLQTGHSKDMPSAMKEAISWYKGSHLEKDVERKYIKRLKDGQKRLSAKRTSKDVAKKYDHPDDEKADIVKGIAKEVGVDLD